LLCSINPRGGTRKPDRGRHGSMSTVHGDVLRTSRNP
jgi:hypothetical protein